MTLLTKKPKFTSADFTELHGAAEREYARALTVLNDLTDQVDVAEQAVGDAMAMAELKLGSAEELAERKAKLATLRAAMTAARERLDAVDKARAAQKTALDEATAAEEAAHAKAREERMRALQAERAQHVRAIQQAKVAYFEAIATAGAFNRAHKLIDHATPMDIARVGNVIVRDHLSQPYMQNRGHVLPFIDLLADGLVTSQPYLTSLLLHGDRPEWLEREVQAHSK